MKKPVKVALIVTSSALLAGGVAATGLVLWQKGVFDSVKFKEDNGIAVITDVARPDRNGNVVVPSEIKGKPVTTIESNAFSNNSKIVNVELPDTIVTIGSRAFANCKNLKTLIIQLQSRDDEPYGSCHDCWEYPQLQQLERFCGDLKPRVYSSGPWVRQYYS